MLLDISRTEHCKPDGFFEVALNIAKQKKPHNIGVALVKPCTVDMVQLLLGETSAKKFNKCLYLTTQLRGAFRLC